MPQFRSTKGQALPSPQWSGSHDITISFDDPDEDGWIVVRILEVPSAISQGRTRDEAKVNVLDALDTVLTADEKLAMAYPPV